MKKHIGKIAVGAVVLIALALSFWWGGNAPGLRGWDTSAEKNGAAVTDEPSADRLEITAADSDRQPQKDSGTEKTDTVPKVDKNVEMDTDVDKYQTAPVPDGKPEPAEPENAVVTDTKLTCTICVKCDTILKNMDYLDPEKAELIPSDGVILPETEAVFYDGENVFDVLQRELKRAKIHMEFTNTPIYNSAYIEGINNIYEFDCGESSGWMYSVNDWFPNYGCSRYKLKEGDKIEWVYTCNLGKDVGGYYEGAKQ